MAGTVVTTETIVGPMQKIVFAWASSGAGAANATTTHAYQGKIETVHVIPGTGADTPDDLFDVTLTDALATDLLYGHGANCSNVNTTVIEDVGPVCNDQLTLGVTNAGATNTGAVVVYVRE